MAGAIAAAQAIAQKYLGAALNNSSVEHVTVALLLVLFPLLLRLYKISITKWHLSKIPSVSGGYPFFGHVFEMIKGSPWDTMTKWMLKHGTIYKFHLFGSDAICLSDPTLLQVVLQTNYTVFKKDLEWTYKPFMVLLGTGLVTADGKNWTRQRSLLTKYLRIEILDEIPDMALRAVQRLCVKLDAAKRDGRPLEMAEEFRHLTLQVIAEALLSLSPEESDQTFAKMYLPIVEEGNLRTWSPERMYLPTPAWFKFRRDVKRLNDYVTNLIESRWLLRQQEAVSSRKTGIPCGRKQDTLDKVLGAVKEEEWSPSVVRQVRDEIKTFVLAGHETSASMLAWSLYELSIKGNASILAKVRQEATCVYGGTAPAELTSATLPKRDALEKLVYTECCLRESLRKYSVVPTVVRVASEETDLGKYRIPKGTTIMVNMQGVHHNPAFWPDPHCYDPSRFQREVQPYTFLPFVEGPRMCLGQYLSLLESKVVLSLLLSKYSFNVVDEAAAGQKHAFMIPIIPRTGHWVTVGDPV